MKKFFLVLALAGVVRIYPACADPSSLEERLAQEERWKSAGVFLLPHRLNYVMPLSYNGSPNMNPYPPGTVPLQKIETQFQISLKVPIADRLFKYNIGTYLAYTQLSFWQAYNKKDSSLFRNTDYEPEIFLQFNDSHSLGSWTNRFNRFGYDHQSNGQSDPLSRSWNRIYGEFVLDHANTMVSVKPWYRLKGPTASDSNPDMSKYMGPGELRGAIKLQSHELSIMLRNNLWTTNNKGAIELGWSFPLIPRMKGFMQFFNGYGQTLLDYNVSSTRISAGFSFSSWL